jgi:4-amino-4-deoxy-L-arabinose transferase-like glycosyltransferase
LPRPHTPHLAILLALAILLLFLGLGSLGLTDRDEGRNAEAGREMFETGDWISPTFNYEPRYAKPVFLYWLMSLSYRLFGVSEFAARLPSALFGVALILLQYLFLTRVRGPLLGLFGGLMLLLNIEMVAIGRMALTDSVLIFFTTLALFGFWLGFHGSAKLTTGAEGRERHFFWLFYLGMALATLTKGPVGVAVPLLAVVPYLTVTRRWGQFWQRGFPLSGALLFLLLALPWYAAMLAIHGSDYTASAQAHTVGRFLNPMEGHGFTIFFYFPVLFFGFFPWSGFLPVALFQAFKGYRQWAIGYRQQNDDPAHRLSPIAYRLLALQELELFAALWLVAVFLFFTASATRLPHYIGPLYPAAAILAASYWTRCLTEPATPGIRASFHTLMGLGYLLGATLTALPSLYATFVEQIAGEFPAAAQVDPGLSPIVAGAVVILGSAIVGYFGLSEDRRPGAFWAGGAMISLVLLLAIQIALPRFSKYFIAPPQELAYAAGLNLGPNDRLIAYGPSRPSLVFYARRKVIMVGRGEEQAMRPYLTQPGRTFILLASRLRPQLPAEAAGFPVILERYGYALLANEPMVKAPVSSPPPKPGQTSKPDPHARFR